MIYSQSKIKIIFIDRVNHMSFDTLKFGWICMEQVKLGLLLNNCGRLNAQPLVIMELHLSLLERGKPGMNQLISQPRWTHCEIPGDIESQY